MDTFERSDLQYMYTWSRYQEDDPRISGIPDSTEFNRMEGEEVLYIIRHLADHLGWELANFGHRVEKLIRERLPENIRTQQQTVRWIKENWR